MNMALMLAINEAMKRSRKKRQLSHAERTAHYALRHQQRADLKELKDYYSVIIDLQQPDPVVQPASDNKTF